jgi:hypothetical protein
VYHARRYIGILLKTANRAFMIFREAVYAATVIELQELALTGAIEMDETLFGGKHHGKRGWGEGQCVCEKYKKRYYD